MWVGYLSAPPAPETQKLFRLATHKRSHVDMMGVPVPRDVLSKWPGLALRSAPLCEPGLQSFQGSNL